MLCDPRSLVGVRNVGEARELLQAIEPRGESTPTEMRVEELLSPCAIGASLTATDDCRRRVDRARQAGRSAAAEASLSHLRYRRKPR